MYVTVTSFEGHTQFAPFEQSPSMSKGSYTIKVIWTLSISQEKNYKNSFKDLSSLQ